MKYANTITHNGKSGWIEATASGKGTFDDPVKVPDDVTPANPKTSEQAPRVQDDGTVAVEDTGTDIPPDPETAKNRLFNKAMSDWNFTRAELRELMNKYVLDRYLDSNNYQQAKAEADDAADPNILGESHISSSQRDWIHDMLDGKV